MTARWCRLTQPENTSSKKVSGGVNGGIGGACPTGGLRSTGAGGGIPPIRWAKKLTFLRRRHPPSAVKAFSEIRTRRGLRT
jgi:hypothetical protein